MPMCGRVKAHLLWMVGVCLLLLGASVPTLAVPPVPVTDLTIEITKVGTPDPVCIGGTVDYTITVTNKGTTQLTNIKIDDPLLGGEITNQFFTGAKKLAVDASAQATISTDVDLFDVQYNEETKEYSLTNTVTVTGKRGGDLVTNSATAEVDVVPPLAITKTADPTEVCFGGTITYTITIANTTKNVTFGDVAVVDPLFASDAFPDGDITALFFDKATPVVVDSDGYELAPGDELTATIDYIVAEGDPSIVEGKIVNTVKLTASPEIRIESIVPEVICVEATATVLICKPEISITKTPNVGSAGVGKTIHYTITIKNTGDVDLRNVRVVDKINGTSTTINLTDLFFPDNTPHVLPAGASISIDFPYTVQSSDPSPLIDTVTVHSKPVGSDTDVAASAQACVKRCSAAGGGEPAQQFLPDMILYDANYHYVAGDNIYNTNGKNQTMNVTIAKGCKLILPLRVENDELTAQSVSITATTANGKKALWNIQYFNAFNGGKGGGDVTSKVTGLGWQPAGAGKIDANKGCDFAIGITPTGSTLKSGDKITILISSTIGEDTDTVKIIATVK